MRTFLVLIVCVGFWALSHREAGAQVIGGSPFYFDHSQQDFEDTDRYEMCVDTVSDAACSTVGVVLSAAGAGEAGMNVYRFTLPTSAPRGNRVIRVRAIGRLDTGASDPSNAVSVRIIGRPSPPVQFRLQPSVIP